MKRLALFFMLLFAFPALAQDVTADFKQLPDGCEKSPMKKCEGWLFTYHYRENRQYFRKDANGNTTHEYVSETLPVTFQYFVSNRQHNNDPWSQTLEEAGVLADEAARKQNINVQVDQ